MKFFRIAYQGLSSPHYELTKADALDMARACEPYAEGTEVKVDLVEVDPEGLAAALSGEEHEELVLKSYKLERVKAGYKLTEVAPS